MISPPQGTQCVGAEVKKSCCPEVGSGSKMGGDNEGLSAGAVGGGCVQRNGKARCQDGRPSGPAILH